MSRRANPTAIGLFLIGAIILAVTGVAALASIAWFERRTTFVSFFGETVNGLDPGAPVKFQGAPVGRVTEILIQINERDKTFQVPVRYEIDLELLTTQLGTYVHLDQAPVLRRQIADGLRAQLQMESIVTGQLYAELTYRPDAPPPEVQTRPTAYPEIPTTPSILAALGTGAGSLVADVLKVLYQVNQKLEEVDMRGLNAAVVASAQSFERLIESPELTGAIERIPGMTEQISQTMAQLQHLATRAGAAIDPLEQQLQGTTSEVALTMQSLRQTLAEVQTLISTDSGVGDGMERALVSFREASEALRDLANALERNPDMLLRGKKVPQ
jgi:paraquat-inducible protein B